MTDLLDGRTSLEAAKGVGYPLGSGAGRLRVVGMGTA